MADLRLIVLVLAACSPADAQAPETGRAQGAGNLEPPPGWQAQPAVEKAAREALGKSTVDDVQAFGEPAMGCYMLWMGIRGSGSAKDIAEQIVKSFVDNKKVVISDVVKPAAEEGLLAFTFESAPYKGRARARLGKGTITTLACWSSDREPKACETACTTVLGGLP